MVKHIVMWKLKDKYKDLPKAKSILSNIKSRIDSVKDMEIGVNFSEIDVAYDISMTLTFFSKKDLRLYREHPDRLRMLGLMKELRKSRVVIDYEIEE